MEHIEVIIVAVALIAVYQLWVSVELVRSALYEPVQRWLQLAVIWFIPVVGAVVVQSMMRSEGKSPFKPEKGYTEPGDSAS